MIVNINDNDYINIKWLMDTFGFNYEEYTEKYKKTSGEIDYLQLKNDIVKWIRKWFMENAGRDDVAVIGMSGGKDSTIAAALCAEALGRDRVLGVLLPDENSVDNRLAEQICNYIGIACIECDITETIGSIVANVEDGFYCDLVDYKYRDTKIQRQAAINIPCRVRMTYLYAIAQSVGGRVVNTCNLSENFVGYFTRWGDGVGDFSPLAQLTTEEVCGVGRVMGLPDEYIDKVPSDGLCGMTDEDNLGFTYKVLNDYIRYGIEPEEVIKERIDTRHANNLFKLNPIPEFEFDINKYN